MPARHLSRTHRAAPAPPTGLGLHGRARALQEAIRPFRVTIPEKEIVDLRRKLAATRWRLERDGAPGTGGIAGHPHQLAAIVPPDVAAVLAAGGPAPAGLSEKKRATFDALSEAAKMGNRSYAVMMARGSKRLATA